MQLTQIVHVMEARVEAQLRMADPELSAVGSELLEALRPSIKLSLMEVVDMAAQEMNGQLVGQRVEIRLVDGEPELTIQPEETATTPPPPAAGETVDAEARITLRLPGYLKDLIAEAAQGAGDSVNAFVVEALRSKAHERAPSDRVRKTIDL